MAARKVISKLTHYEANVKVTNPTADNATIDLDTDLFSAAVRDTLNGTQIVDIQKIMWSVSPIAGAAATLTRNSVVLCTLCGTGELNLNANGMSENEGHASDIVVTFIGTGGTVWLKLKKISGYETGGDLSQELTGT